METERTHLIVQCDRCGTLNRKKLEDHKAVCKKCGKTTGYVVFPSGLLPSQSESLILEYNEQVKYLATKEGIKESKEWKEIVKEEEKDLKKKKEEHYNFEEMFKKEKKK